MKAKFIKSIVIAIIVILGVGCVSLPFFFRPNEKAIAETLDPERVDWVLLDGNVPVALHYNNNGQKSFLTQGTTIPFSENNSISFEFNPIEDEISQNDIYAVLNANNELEKVDTPTYIASVTQLRINGVYKKAGGSDTNFSIAVTGEVDTDENANFNITKKDTTSQYTASYFIVDGNEQPIMGPGDYTINITYSYRLQDGTQFTDGQAQFTFSIIDDSIYTTNPPTMNNVDPYTQNDTTEYVYNFNKFDPTNKKFLYPEFSYNAKLYQYNIERNVADKVYLYQYLNTDLINNKINYAVYYGSQYLRNESFDIKQNTETGTITATLQFKELGEYTLTPTLIDSNGVPYNIPKVNEITQDNTKTLVIFGYILNYTSSDGTKLELMDEEQKIWASTGATNSNNTIGNLTDTAPAQTVITNQVPLVFSYLGNLDVENSGDYTGGSISAPDDYDLTINYSYTSKKGFEYIGQQQFEFTIDNSNPDIYVAYKDNGNDYIELNKKYINKDLYIGVNNSTSPFMAPVKVKVDQKDYTGNIINSYYLNPTTQKIDITIDGETPTKKEYTIYSTGDNVASLKGEYKFDVSYIYGPNQSVEKATYIIDKSNVTGIEFNKMGPATIDGTITVSSSRVVLSNSPFVFTWISEKSSGAKTWAKYTFAPITDNSITKASYTLSDNKIGVTNGYAISSYDQTQRIVDAILDNEKKPYTYTSTSYSGLGVYFIAFEDEAGNSIEYAVINDTSLPYFLQESRTGQDESGMDIYENSYNPANPANIITDRTKITFGDYKLLNVTNEDVINKLTNYNVLKNSEETTFLASSVNNSYNVQNPTEQDTIINNNTAVIYKNQNDYNNSPIAGTYPIVSTPEQNIFLLYSIDANGNKTNRQIWMNLDKSQLQAIINVGTTEEPTNVTITPDSGTNSNNLSLTFIPGGEGESFEVEAIVMEYYAFVASGSTNYPFATTPTSTATLYKKGDTDDKPGNSHENYPATTRTLISQTDDDDGKTTYTISNFYLSEDKIMSGMYIFKRIYTDSTPIDPDDPKEYTYRIFVDRNNIVDKEQNIGNFINVTVGFSTLNTDNEQVSFTAWDRKVDGEYAFITNKLPTKLYIPYSKYFDGTNSSQYYFSYLNVTIKYTAEGQNPVEYYYTFNSAEQPYLDISTLSGAGTYEVTITDNTGYSMQGEDGNTQLNVNPNTFSFKYKIEHVAPQIDVYANDVALNRENGNNYYTNIKSGSENELYATWTDPIDPYYAKVEKIFINGNVINLEQDSIIYELCNAQSDKKINYKNTGLMITFVNEYNYNGQIYYQFSYKYSFDISGTEDKTFTIELIYRGSSDKYTFNGIDYSKSTYTINLDRTRPDINIDNLYNNDAYLQSLINSTQYNDFKNLTEDNVNASLPNIENYIFAVNENFVLNADYDAYPSFYVIKLSNKNTPLAITPDHYLYGKYSDYNGRFDFESNIATMLGYKEISYNGTSLLEQLKQADDIIPEGDTISGYYEIIERDYAGNYRNYVVYIIDQTELNDNKVELFKFGNSDISNIEDNYTVIREWNIPSFSSVLSWYTLKINNESYVFKNNDNDVDTINDINSFIATQFNQNITFHINLIGSTNSSTIVRAIYTHIPFTSQNFKIAKYESDAKTKYEIAMPSFDSNSSIVLTSLKIVNDKNQSIYEATYDNISDIPSRITDDMLDSTSELTKGLYTFTVTDNYTDATGASKYSFVVAIDVNDLTYEDKYEYKSNKYFDTTSNTTYTNGSVKVNYLNSYTVEILRNGVKYEADSTVVGDSNINYIKLEAPEFNTKILTNATGDKYVYEISYLMNGQQIGASDTIVIYNKISKINVNYLDNNLVSFDETNNTTSKAIKFSWENFKDTDVVNDFVATLEYLDDSGQTLITDNYTMGTPINPQPSTNRYRFNLINTLLNYKRSVEFTISTTDTNLYSVEVNEQPLNPSPIDLDLNAKLDNSTSTVFNAIQSSESDTTIKNILEKCNLVTEQYYTNQKSFNIITNSDNNLKLKYYIFRNGKFEKATSTFEYNDEWNNAYITYIVLIYGQTNPIYEKLIGVTIVPTTTRFTNDGNYLQYINKNGIQTTIDNQRITLRNDVVTNSQIDLVWNINYTQQTTWYNAGNIVYINYTYNNNTSTLITGQVYNNTMYRQTIKGAGNHTIEMYDWAGNKTRFGTGSSYLVDYCTITIIDQVVYTINNSAPIQYAIYNSGVVLDIDSVFSNYYLPNSLTINVKKDGSTYTGYTIVDKAYLFEETGRYEVYINARYATTGTELTETAYNFSIINPNSSRLAWEFSGINGYEIVKVIKNNTDITADIKGNKASINTLYLSTSDQNYGKGIYTITIGAQSNDIMEMSYYTFTVRINDEVPVINSNPGYGETTKGVITIEYNPGQIYDQLGNATIRVLTYNEESGTFNLFGDIKINETNAEQNYTTNFILDQTNDYYIQLVTDSGNIALSFRVNRAEPLNAIAIIVIIASVITVVVLIIVFIKLRTKMKIR